MWAAAKAGEERAAVGRVMEVVVMATAVGGRVGELHLELRRAIDPPGAHREGGLFEGPSEGGGLLNAFLNAYFGGGGGDGGSWGRG